MRNQQTNTLGQMAIHDTRLEMINLKRAYDPSLPPMARAFLWRGSGFGA